MGEVRRLAPSIILGAFALAVACSDPNLADGAQTEEASDKTSDYFGAEAKNVGCAILADFVTREFDRADKPLFLSDESSRSTFDNVDETARTLAYIDNPDGNGTASLKQRKKAEALFELVTLSPTAQCPKVKAIQAKHSHKPDPNEDYPATTPDGLFFVYDTLSVQMPLVDFQEGEAVFETSYFCGPLCANGAVVTYRRDEDGEWTLFDTMPTWLS